MYALSNDNSSVSFVCWEWSDAGCYPFTHNVLCRVLKFWVEFKLGGHTGHVSYSVLGYAEDVGLLTPSVKAIQALLHICETISEEFRVVFNFKKTMCMRISSDDDPPARVVLLNGSPLAWIRRMKHLCNIITCQKTGDISCEKGNIVSQVNRHNCDATCLQYLTMLRVSCCKHIAVHSVGVSNIGPRQQVCVPDEH